MKAVIFKALLVIFFIPAMVVFAGTGPHDMRDADVYKTNSARELRTNMRKLWEDHVTYTRNFIISALDNLGDLNAVTERLLRNQDDIGGAAADFYGKDAGKKISALLRDHILIAADIVNAAKAGKKDLIDVGQEKWKANGEAIGALLSSANPNWNKKDLGEMLSKHLEYTTDEVVTRLNKKWDADIKAYDKGHEHMLMFADQLSAGIIKQFPDKFKD